jgi:hypothetical protein
MRDRYILPSRCLATKPYARHVEKATFSVGALPDLYQYQIYQEASARSSLKLELKFTSL